MDVIKNWLFLVIFGIPFFVFSQAGIYPKDTIYVLFKAKEGNRKIINWDYQKKNGIYFTIKAKSNKHISLFYTYSEKADTLCIGDLKNYHFSDLEEINERRNKWIFDNKRPPATRNGVFQTYLIEVISENKFIKYPVIWRNEKI